MNLLISLTLAIIFVASAQEKLRRRPMPFYIGATVISLVVVVCTFLGIRFPAFVNTWLWPVFSRGGLTGALFILVMVAGALPNGSWGIKKLMPVRRQLSILACILTLGHNIAYGKTYFVMLFSKPENLPTNQFAAAICPLVMIAIMLPLFVTSFISVRKKMDARKWKKLQRLAYLFYGLLYCHILLVTFPSALRGRSGYGFTVFLYSSIYLSYAICRILKYLDQKRKRGQKSKSRIRLGKLQGICAAGITAVSLVVSVILFGQTEGKTEIAAQSGTRTDTSLQNIQEDQDTKGQSMAGDEATSVPDIQKGGESRGSVGNFKGRWRDGEYTGSAMGMNADITVRVTVKDGSIADIEIISQKDDPEYFSDSLIVIEWMLEANDTDVDTVSGATYSSGGIIDAVADALKEAGN